MLPRICLLHANQPEAAYVARQGLFFVFFISFVTFVTIGSSSLLYLCKKKDYGTVTRS